MSARALAGRVPDAAVAPILRFITEARDGGLGPNEIDADELVECLVLAALQQGERLWHD